jgi:hypothetical protein
MVADLHRPFAAVGHVTIGTSDATAGVDALAPRLELGVLRLQHWRFGLAVRPVPEAGFVVVGLDLVGLQALVPRVRQHLTLALEVVLNVALPADEAAHLLAARHGVDVVVVAGLGAAGGAVLAPLDDARQVRQIGVARGKCLDAVEEAGPRHSQLHGRGIMAIDAGDRVRNQPLALGVFLVMGLLVGHGAGFDKPGLDVAAAEVAIKRQDRGVAVQAGAGLLHLVDALGLLLVREHVGVPALLAVVEAEGVAGEDALEARVSLELGGRQPVAAAEFAALVVGGPQVAVVLAREVAAPDRRVHRVLGEVGEFEILFARLALALHDVH